MDEYFKFKLIDEIAGYVVIAVIGIALIGLAVAEKIKDARRKRRANESKK